ncbi:MAG: acyl-CoA dehydrogenase [Planctomycetota bacterium]|nr:MAG: acyl-CoA dehydrogenase [Planctomycetota bacterium]
MDFRLSEEHKMVRDTARDFAQNVVAPRAAEIDEKEEFPWDIWKQAAELGFTGITVPEEYGGAGMDTLAYVLMGEEISKACASTAIVLGVQVSLACEPILRWGSEELKRKYLVPLAKGEVVGCMAMTEPNAGSDVGGIRTRAVLDGNEWVLNGTKIFISNAKEAGIAIVFAQTDPERGKRGFSAFVVEADTPGYKVTKKEKKLGIRGSSTCEIVLEDVRVPKENVVGRPGDGFKIGRWTLDGGRILVAAQAVGIAQAALEAAVNYSKERQQFGRPIASFQGLQFMLADMATELEAARLLTYKAACLKDAGEDYVMLASMAKLKAAEVSEFVTSKALQIHGGYGYIKEFPLERYWRDARITQIYEGTSEIQRLIIARRLLRG